MEMQGSGRPPMHGQEREGDDRVRRQTTRAAAEVSPTPYLFLLPACLLFLVFRSIPFSTGSG